MNLTERQVAERNNISVKHLQTMRAQHRGPYWLDLNNEGRNADHPETPITRKPMIRYPQSRLADWDGVRDEQAAS